MRVPRVRERTADPEELAQDRQRCLAAKAKPPTPAPETEVNLCRTLAYLAAWRPCPACGALVLYVNERARTDGKFTCGRCDERREAMGRRLRRPSLHERARFHLAALFTVSNDNGVALMGGG